MAYDNSLKTGALGGQTIYGGTGASENLTLESTSDATKGNVLLNPNGGNVGIGTSSPTSKIHANTTLSAPTGNEVAYSLDYTTNKATSGNDTGLLINMTDTGSPGSSILIDTRVGGVTKMRVDNVGNLVLANTVVATAINSAANSQIGIGLSIGSPKINMLGGGYNDVSISGQRTGVSIAPIYNQTSSTASNTDLLINRTETAVGSGAQRLIDAQVGGISKFNVDNTGLITINTNKINITTAKTPASEADTGTTGDIAWDSNYIYVCVATNTWKRATLLGGW